MLIKEMKVYIVSPAVLASLPVQVSCKNAIAGRGTRETGADWDKNLAMAFYPHHPTSLCEPSTK